ncbi:hypothetical protein [Crassaminicella profunda]|uniref:hypothetical protein n=1 Tax=Crassaminicella profunda TaxID=1286698 RepID=UPI001CA747CE|nr:hypothetical protein [Crassaminicella profunda]QZY54495.1 hypothetical protein K7H06_15835 [Crassaminicella profunda]
MSYSVNIKNMDLMIKTALLPMTQIEYFENNPLEKKGANQKRAIYPVLNKYMTIDNLDEINMFWELFYPKRKVEEYDYNVDIYCLELLKKFSRTFIAHRDGRLVFKYWETENNKYFKVYKGISKVLLWNSLNRYFTTDILGVLYLLDNDKKQEEYLEGYYSRVALEDMQLESILKKGTAETHLHVSASTDFYTSWKNLMNLYNDEPKALRYHEVIGSKKYTLGKYFKVASILRMIMACFLVKYKHLDCCFRCFVELIPYLRSDTDKKNSIFYEKPLLNTFITELLSEGQEKEVDYERYEKFEEEELKNIFILLFEDVFNVSTGSKEEDINKLQNDPMDILNYMMFDEESDFKSEIGTYTENIFLMKAVKYIDKNECDKDFSNCFMNYLRVKNEFFSFMVQGNEIKGLNNFEGYFQQSTKNGRYSDKNICWEERLNAQFKDKNLKKLEIRISPADVFEEGKKNQFRRCENIKREMCEELLLIFEAYKKILKRESECDFLEGSFPSLSDHYNWLFYLNQYNAKTILPIPQLGIIYHFIKKPDLPINKKCWVDYEREKEREHLYYEKQKYEYELQAEAILKIRKEIPKISEYIVGIDGASIENYADPWVFSQVYDELRDSLHSMYGEGMKPLKTLGFTFHAGEDFRHILTGLRRIDETIDRYKYHAGDRIGHGIALGINIKCWREKHPVVTMPRMEYLENLIWIWGSCKYNNSSIDMGYLERKIMDYAKEIYVNTEGITIYNLWEAYECKFKKFDTSNRHFKIREDKVACEAYSLEEMICCPCIEGENRAWDKEKLIGAYYCKKYLEKMVEPIQVEVPKEKLSIIQEMQKLVLKKTSNKGIIVETNPTSNTAIGEIENIFNHYITKLNSIENSGNIDSLMISINTDDPSVFNTNLSNEFAYIFYSLVEKGYSKEKVLQWIDKIREHGMNSSFIREDSKSVQQVLIELDLIIRELRKATDKSIV